MSMLVSGALMRKARMLSRLAFFFQTHGEGNHRAGTDGQGQSEEGGVKGALQVSPAQVMINFVGRNQNLHPAHQEQSNDDKGGCFDKYKIH